MSIGDRIDRAIGMFAPKAAVRRMTARNTMRMLGSGYSNHGASREKNALKGWLSHGASPKEDIDQNLATLRQRARDLDMGGGIARGALRTMRTSIVGEGLTVRPTPDAEFLGMSSEAAQAWQRNVLREFALWAGSRNCDMDRQSTFYELQQLAQLSWLASGDVFVLPLYIPRRNSTYDLRLRILEADLVCTPNMVYDTGDPVILPNGNTVVSGVEMLRNGCVTAYHIASRHPLDTYAMEPLEWQRVELFGPETGRQNILHLIDLERPGQRRGVPFLSPVMETMKQLERYQHAEIMNALVTSMFSIFIESELPHSDFSGGIDPAAQIDADDDSTIELGSGTINQLRPGERIEQASMQRGNPVYDAFVTAMCRDIGAALEIPYEVLLRQFNSSYSASRAAQLEFWRVVRMRRNWMINALCQPVYEEWLSEAVAKGRVYAPGFFDDPAIRAAYCRAEWAGPTQGQLDPLKEVQAAELRVAGGYSTRQREAAEMNGTDFEENTQQRGKEERLREKNGLIGGNGDQQEQGPIAPAPTPPT